MATNLIQSAGLRFLRKFGVSFFWAIVVGLAFGAATYLRLDRSEVGADPVWHVLPRLWLEQLEWRTLDWRARELGSVSERTDDVVLVTVDDETVGNAQASAHPEWASRPWPRELVGDVAAQALAEGAALVVIDEVFDDVSPRQCAPCRGEPAGGDDQRFGARLAKLGDKVVLGFELRREPRRPPERPLLPVLVRVGEVGAEPAALPMLQRVLSQRTTAYLAAKDGAWQIWAGAVNETKGRELAAALEVKGATVTRSLTAADDALEITREALLQRIVRAQLSGYELDGAPRVGLVEAPLPQLLLPAAPVAALTLVPDQDGVVRQVPSAFVVGRAGEAASYVPGLAVRVGARMAGAARVAQPRAHVLEVGGKTVPVDDHGFLTLQWNDDEAGRSGRGTMKRAVPAWRLLVNREDDLEGRGVRHHDNELQGRVVVLTDERTSPTFLTPVGRLSRGAIQAQAIADVLHGQGISRVPPQVDFWITVAFAFVGAFLAVAWSSLVRRPGWLAWVATLGLVLGVHALLARQLYVTQHRQVAMVAPFLACAATFLASLGYARTLEQSLRDFMLRALGGAVRADVFSRVERDLKLMHPERRELTLYFSDIEGFTAVSDAKPPEVVVDVLRQYLAEMTTVVLDKGGHVDKYLGDGLMAFWGAPVKLPNDAAAACDAALTMQARFEAKRPGWEERCGRAIVMRAGVETGPAVVGEMGTVHRINYTVMGEPVASCFRLEALAKKYGVRILVGQGTREAAGDGYAFRSVDTVRLGRVEAPVRLYELLGTAEALKGQDWLGAYEAAHTAFRERRFHDALEGFTKLKVTRPEDVLVERYLKRAQAYVASPPLDDWDGVVDDTVIA